MCLPHVLIGPSEVNNLCNVYILYYEFSGALFVSAQWINHLQLDNINSVTAVLINVIK